MNFIVDLTIAVTVVLVIYVVNHIFFGTRKPIKKCDVALVEPCTAFIPDKDVMLDPERSACWMQKYHTGPHRLKSGEAFSTARRKAREAKDKSVAPVDPYDYVK